MIVLKITGFIGRSGTGKSTRALKVAEKENADYIIDDGLFIKVDKKRIITGISAKNFNTFKEFVRMVDTALFNEYEHSKNVRYAIEQCCPNHMLVLSPSLYMLAIIKRNLYLPSIDKVIRIEDVATPEQIEEALESRKRGRHSLPISYEEIPKALRCFAENCLNKEWKVSAVNKKQIEIIREL